MSITIGRSTRVGAVVVALALSASAVAACSPAATEDTDATVLTHLEPQTFTTLYPPAAGFYPNGVIVNNITDRLLHQDPDTLELHPWIATDLPEVNGDSTVFTFDIRTDVTYSDGSPLTAENVVRNFDLYGLGDSDRLLTVSEQITNYERGEVIDEDTVRFHFSEPAPGFAQATSSFNAGLLADASLDLTQEGFGPGNATQIIGSGPFVIADETLGTELILEARDDYEWAPPSHEHQGPPRLDRVNVTVAGEESVRVGALTSGQADTARQIEAPVERHLIDRGLEVIWNPTSGVNNHLSMRFQHPLLEDKRVRQAIIHGIDRDEILYTLFSDSYPKATSALAENALGYKEQPAKAYEYDPDKAAALLEDAGWTEFDGDGYRVKDGQRLSLTVNEALPQPRSREVITKIQEQLSRLGVQINLNPGDQATQNADSKDMDKIQLRHTMVGRADYDVIKSEFSVDNRDELAAVDPETGEPADPHLEELLQNIASSAEEADRADYTRAAQDYLTEQAYILPLFEEPVVYGVQPYIQGFQPEAIGRPSFYGAWIDSEFKEGQQ